MINTSKIFNGMEYLFNEYDHKYTNHGIQAVLNGWESPNAKLPLINLLRKHPNWDEENLAIIFSNTYQRTIDYNQIVEFRKWCDRTYRQKIGEEDPSFEEQVEANEVRYMGHTYDYWIHKANISPWHSQAALEARKACWVLDSFPFIAGYYVNYTFAAKFSKVNDFLSAICNYYNPYDEEGEIKEVFNTDPLASADLAKELNRIIPEVKAKQGQKVSRIIRKMGEVTKLNQVKEMGRNGRDYGWNRRFAMVADAINPLTITRHTIISVNPLDYLTSSFGHKWASCHTIDHHNYRNVEDTYHGMYMSGTISYMLDPSTIVFYTVDASYKGRDFWKEDKMKRCLFHFEADKNTLVQGRVYPDGRDSGEIGLSAQFRTVMQQVLSTCLDVPNLWKKGKHSEICRHTIARGTNYQDFYHYDDCTISYLQNGNDPDTIHIGHRPISIYSGKEHDAEDSLSGTCYVCDECGSDIDDINDAITIDDRVFCCEECADEAGYVFATDREVWVNRDVCTYNDFTEEWIYNDYDMVTSDDGMTGFSYDLIGNGYRETDHGWTRHWRYCEVCDRYVHKSDWDEDHEMCNDCVEDVIEEVEEAIETAIEINEEEVVA